MACILKSLREKTEMKQEEVAECLNVSVNTIQNWERTDHLSKDSLHVLMDLYAIPLKKRNDIVLSVFGENQKIYDEFKKDNFPYFFCVERQDVVDAAQKAVLSSEEMNLFGYSYYLNGINNSSYYEDKPYEYDMFKDFGGFFKTMNMIFHIECKIGDYNFKPTGSKGLLSFVYYYGIDHPDEGFSFCHLSPADIENHIADLPLPNKKNSIEIKGLGALCQMVREDIFLGTTKEKNKNIDDVENVIVYIDRNYICGSNMMIYEIKLKNDYARCFEITTKEITDTDYLQRKSRYLSDKKTYDEHPDLYDRSPSFTFQYDYWLRLTEIGKKYLAWYEN